MSEKRLHIFKSGKHTTSAGVELAFSDNEVSRTAEVYDPAVSQAPIVVGHPREDGPAYGWVKGLDFSEGDLSAEPEQVDPEFADMVNAGRFKNISASFYDPDSASNPVPGTYYLRHVGFLGAQPPSVKGLKQASFSEDDDTIEFMAPYSVGVMATLMRRMREWIIGRDGVEEADKVIPDYLVQDLEDESRLPDEDTAPPLSPAYSESEDNTMTPEQLKAAQDKLADDQAALDADKAKLTTDQTSFAERETAMKGREAAATLEANTAYVDGLIKSGKVAPGQKGRLIAFMGTLDGTVEFKEGDADKTEGQGDSLKAFLDGLPKAVDFGEHGATGDDGDDDPIDPAELSQRAVAFQETQAKKGIDINIVDAVKAVEAGKDK